VPTRGAALRLDIGMDDDAEVYVNGKFLLKFNWDGGQMTLTDHVQPGQVFLLAVRGINGPGTGGLRHARLVYSLFAPLERYVRDAQFVDRISASMPPAVQVKTRTTLAASEGALDMTALKHCEDGPGYVLRLFETQGHNAVARLSFSVPVHVQETDLLERPVHKRALTTSVGGRTVSFPVGHDQIVTLRITGLPDAGRVPSALAPRTARLP